jgi:hypothetical protein
MEDLNCRECCGQCADRFIIPRPCCCFGETNQQRLASSVGILRRYMLEHPQTVATHVVPVDDPCQTLESIRRRNLCDNEEFNQVRTLIDRVVKEFEVDHLTKFALSIYDYQVELFVHLVRQSPTLVDASNFENYTALHCAASFRPSDVPILIELGASINKLTDMNETPLDRAYWYQKENAVRILLKNGASTMIGQRKWLSTDDPGDPIRVVRLIRRSYYLSLVYQMNVILDCHLRNVINMLV